MANGTTRRAAAAQYPRGLADWAHDKLVRGLELDPVGDGPRRMVDLEIPDLAHMAIHGNMPNPLAAIALRVEEGVTPAKLTDDEKGAYFDLMCHVIATQLRKPDLVSDLGGLDAAVKWVAEQMPPTHRIAIWQRCVHLFGPDDILAMIQLAEDAAEDQVSGRDVKSISDLATFRDEPTSAEVPASGRAEGAAAE